MIGTHGPWHATWVPLNTHVTRTKTRLHCMTHLRRSDVYVGTYLYLCEVFLFDNLVVDDIK